MRELGYYFGNREVITAAWNRVMQLPIFYSQQDSSDLPLELRHVKRNQLNRHWSYDMDEWYDIISQKLLRNIIIAVLQWCPTF